MHIRGEMTSGKWTLSGFVRSRLASLWWFEVDFWPRSVHFRRGPPTIFRKHMPSGMGTKSLGVIGCIFAENGPLEGGIESSFWGTGWGAKGDFMRYSYLYPYIFESRTHTFFESTCPELYEQQSWEWSDAYSWRNDLWKVNFKRVCDRLESLWGFGIRAPPFSESTCPQVFLGMIGCIFAENGPLEGGIESSFWGTGWGAKGDFRRIFGPDPFIFEGGPFSESTCPHLWEWLDVYSRRPLEGLKGYRLGWISCVILTYTRTFSNGEPIPFSKAHALSYTYLFRKHMPSGMGTESWEWSDAYSRRNEGHWKRVISCVILTYTRTFSNQEPIK